VAGKLETAILEVLWGHGPMTVRKLLESFPRKGRPAYNTILTVMVRMKRKGLVAIAGKAGNANLYQAALSHEAAQRRAMDEMLEPFAGQASQLMPHLIDAGKLSLKDVEEAERRLRASLRKPGKR
jgi:predicted transcriptional regulator